MTSLPLHPAIVHIPLGLAFIMPLLALGFGWARWTGRVRPRAWLAIVALQALLMGAGLVAMNTGEHEEERVETVVPDAALSRHEQFAEQFVWAVGLTLGLMTIGVGLRRTVAVRAVTVAAIAGTLVVAGLAVRVGHAGGQLVYVHNAGSAYAAVRSASAASGDPSGSPSSQMRASSGRRQRPREER